MDLLTLINPVFAAYAAAAAVMILKGVGMSWLTVARMVGEKGGFRSPEDLKRTPLNREPDPTQLAPNERVERVRRIQMNDLENLPYFLVAGFLYVLIDPPVTLAVSLFAAYTITRLLHFGAYLTAQTHDLRAALWTPGSLITVFMAGSVLYAVLAR